MNFVLFAILFSAVAIIGGVGALILSVEQNGIGFIRFVAGMALIQLTGIAFFIIAASAVHLAPTICSLF